MNYWHPVYSAGADPAPSLGGAGLLLPPGFSLPPGFNLPPGMLPGSLPSLPGSSLTPGCLPGTFCWNRARGEAVLASWQLQGGTTVMSSDDLRQGLVTALFHAELAAAAAGLTVPIETPNGPGFILGGAEAKARLQPDLPASQVYLRMLDAVRAALDHASPAPENANTTLGLPEIQLAALPAIVVVGLVVVGVAALAALAYVATRNVQIAADYLVRTKTISACADFIAAGKPIPPEFAQACLEASKPTPGPDVSVGLPTGLVVGGLVVGAGLLYFLGRK